MGKTLRSRARSLRQLSKFRFEALEPRLFFSGDYLVVTQIPSLVNVGQNIGATGQAYVVDLVKSDGSVDTSYNGQIQISLWDPIGPAGGTPADATGTFTVNAKNGLATFNDVTFTELQDAGTGIGLIDVHAADPNNDPSLGSPSIWVYPSGASLAGRPAQLKIVQQPTLNGDGSFSLTVAVEDIYGNPVATGVNVNLVIASGPAGALLYSGGPSGQTVVYTGDPYSFLLGGDPAETVDQATAVVGSNGLATFTNLSVTMAGTYTFFATYDFSTLSQTSISFDAPASPPYFDVVPPSFGPIGEAQIPFEPVMLGWVGDPKTYAFVQPGPSTGAGAAVKFAAAPVSTVGVSPFSTASPTSPGAESQVLGIGAGTLDIASNPSLLD